MVSNYDRYSYCPLPSPIPKTNKNNQPLLFWHPDLFSFSCTCKRLHYPCRTLRCITFVNYYFAAIFIAKRVIFQAMDDTKSQPLFANKKKLLKSLLIFSLIIISWFAGPTNRLWDLLDVNCAKSFNYLFVHSRVWQSIAIFFNSRSADWIFDIVMIVFFAISFRKNRTRSLTTLLLAITICAAIQVTNFRVFSRRIVPNTFQYQRKSPSITLANFVRVQDLIPNCKTKDSSEHCFPGDHATTCALFVIASTILYGRIYGTAAFFSSLPILLARCFVGAHWISDIIVGSYAMALLYLSLLFYTPLFDTIAKKVSLIRKKSTHVRFRKNL